MIEPQIEGSKVGAIAPQCPLRVERAEGEESFA
jgi:hypothetical protein